MKKNPVWKIVRSDYYIPTLILFLFLLYVAALVFYYSRQVTLSGEANTVGHPSISQSGTP
ncbi:MAG TPA: hypothetical protein VF408_10030 [Sediminibacterium sp.]